MPELKAILLGNVVQESQRIHIVTYIWFLYTTTKQHSLFTNRNSWFYIYEKKKKKHAM